jgi:hypothetical protein
VTDIDDPTIPEELRTRLRRASQSQDVGPATLDQVQQRARQRRRRRRALVSAGAVSVVLVAGLAVAALAGDRSERVVTLTRPERTDPASAPQPLLVPGGPTGAEVVLDGLDTTAAGIRLDELTVDGTRTWWATEPGWRPRTAVVLADGRRFGLADGAEQSEHAGAFGLDEIDADGRTVDRRSLDAATPGGGSTSVAILGASGTEVILQRTTTPAPTGAAGETLVETSSIVAVDVDSGAERTVVATGGDLGVAAASADVLVRSIGTDCTLTVQPLHGTEAPRELDGSCPPGVEDGYEGMAISLATSPDGRYAAVVWTMLRPTGLPDTRLTVIDLDTGAVVQEGTRGGDEPVAQLAWTGERRVSLAVADGAAPFEVGDGPVRVDSIGWAGLPAD